MDSRFASAPPSPGTTRTALCQSCLSKNPPCQNPRPTLAIPLRGGSRERIIAGPVPCKAAVNDAAGPGVALVLKPACGLYTAGSDPGGRAFPCPTLASQGYNPEHACGLLITLALHTGSGKRPSRWDWKWNG